jgi:hypothetical protein
MSERNSCKTSRGDSESGDTRFEIMRGFSILIALFSLAIAYGSSQPAVFHFTLLFVVLPLGCIWFGKEIGGFSTDAQAAGFTPVGTLITYTGWCILLGMLAALIWLRL